MKLDANMAPVGSVEAKDDFAMAPPGYGLTSDNQRWPWGQPPKDSDPSVVLDKAIAAVSETAAKREMFKLLTVGVSVEVIVEGYIFQGFSDGKFSPDVGLLIKGPLGIAIAGMADKEGIPYRLFENDDQLERNEMDDETFFRMMKKNNPTMFAYMSEQINEGLREGYAPQEPEEENFMTIKKQTKEAS